MSDLDFYADNPFLGVSPLSVLQHWVAEATKCEINDPTAMAIATIGADGYPQNRMVLCRDINPLGVIFYTNKNGAKGQSLQQNPKISALFHWKTLRKQIRLVGQVQTVHTDLNQQYFSSRSTLSQLGAWASRQSAPLDCRQTLDTRLYTVREKFAHTDPIPCPDFWGGFQIIVEKIEFWCEGDHRLHNRFILTRPTPDSTLADVNIWGGQRLYP